MKLVFVFFILVFLIFLLGCTEMYKTYNCMPSFSEDVFSDAEIIRRGASVPETITCSDGSTANSQLIYSYNNPTVLDWGIGICGNHICQLLCRTGQVRGCCLGKKPLYSGTTILVDSFLPQRGKRFGVSRFECPISDTHPWPR